MSRRSVVLGTERACPGCAHAIHGGADWSGKCTKCSSWHEECRKKSIYAIGELALDVECGLANREITLRQWMAAHLAIWPRDRRNRRLALEIQRGRTMSAETK